MEIAAAPMATQEALAQARALLGSIDHAGRARLDAHARLALVTEVLALGRQVEALRAVLIGEADRAKAADTARGTSIRTLVAVSAQVTAGEAAGWLYAGQEIVGRPALQSAALSGEISVAQARAIDHVLGELPATLEADQRGRAEELMLAKAQRLDAKDLANQTRRVLEEVAPEVDAVEDELARLDAERRQAWSARSLVFHAARGGSIGFKGQLPKQEGEAFQKLVEGYVLTNRRAQEQSADRHDEPGLRTHEQRVADGLITLVRAHGGGRPDALGPLDPTDADAPGGADGAGVSVAGPTGGPARKPLIVATMSLDLLVQQREQAGVLGTEHDLSAAELRRLLCDCDVLPVVLGSASEPLDVGRQRRLVTAPIRRALEARDKGCAFPGCRVGVGACEAHHIRPWWAGGPTSLANLVLLCPHHHGTVEPLRFWHDTGGPPRWQVHMGADGHPEFLPPPRPGQSSRPEPIRNQRTLASIESRPPPAEDRSAAKPSPLAGERNLAKPLRSPAVGRFVPTPPPPRSLTLFADDS